MPDAPANIQAGPPLHYGLDIETDTAVDGLDPTNSAVVAVAVSTVEGDTVLTGPEPELLAGLDHLLGSLPPGVIVTWNGSSFDLPFLIHRSRLLDVPLGLVLHDPAALPVSRVWPPPPDGFRATWGAHGHLDGFRLYRCDVRRTVGVSCGLKAMARLVGLPVVEVDRSAVHELGPAELEAYVSSDARLARQLVARRMPAAQASIDRGALPVAAHPTSGDDVDGRPPTATASDRRAVHG